MTGTYANDWTEEINSIVIKYYCENDSCEYGRQKRPVLEFIPEALMDENNVAQFFCPYCKSRLRKSALELIS